MPDQESEPAIDFKRHADELRDVWQARVLAEALRLEGGYAAPRDPMGMVILSMLAHSYDNAMDILLRVVFPGFRSIGTPFLVEAGRIAKTGHVMSAAIDDNGTMHKNIAMFRDELAMQRDFRRLADRLKLRDRDRTELFAALRRWVVCDYRLDPTMNPRDPDAKRLVVN